MPGDHQQIPLHILSTGKVMNVTTYSGLNLLKELIRLFTFADHIRSLVVSFLAAPLHLCLLATRELHAKEASMIMGDRV